MPGDNALWLLGQIAITEQESNVTRKREALFDFLEVGQ